MLERCDNEIKAINSMTCGFRNETYFFLNFGPSVTCSGNVRLEDFDNVGAGAVIRQGRPGEPLIIGKGAVIGMGAVVTKSVPPGAVVAGNPARLLRE